MKTKLIGAALILSLAPLVSAEEAAAPGAAEKCFSADTNWTDPKILGSGA